MKILVIGGGGREHALAWKVAQNKEISRVYVAPGNAGTALDPDMMNVPITKVDELVEFALKEQIYLTIVGPEAPLSQGVVDAFRAANLKIFGPTKAAAQLESSKDFAKAFMVRHNIPTAAYATFTDAKLAHDYVAKQGAPIVIKADGLAAGKGVVVAMNDDEAHTAIDMMLADNKLGAAGARVVIEEFLEGEEASFMVMVDGKNILELAVVALRPDVGLRLAVDELDRNAHAIGGLPHAALDHIVDAELPGDATCCDLFPLVHEDRVAGDDEEIVEAGHFGDDVLGQAVGKEFLVRIAAHVHERQHGDRGYARRRLLRVRGARNHGRAGLPAAEENPEDAKRPADVLDLLFAKIVAMKRQFVFNLLEDTTGDVDASRFRQPL